VKPLMCERAARPRAGGGETVPYADREDLGDNLKQQSGDALPARAAGPPRAGLVKAQTERAAVLRRENAALSPGRRIFLS
jgi:hypothetical protein